MGADQKTKLAIATALKELSQKKALSKITVMDISEESHVNRSTIYYHFADKDDIISWIFQNDIANHFIKAKPHQWVINTQHLLEIFYRDASFYRQALQLDTQNNLRKIIYDTTYLKARELIEYILNGRMMPEHDIAFIAKFYSYAFTEMNLEYLLSTTMESPEREVRRYYMMSEPCYQIAVDNFLKEKSS